MSVFYIHYPIQFDHQNELYLIWLGLKSILILFVWKFLFAILMLIPVLLIVAYSTVLERKILASAQK